MPQHRVTAADLQPPAWMISGTRPPHLPTSQWAHLPPEDKQAIVDAARRAWDRVMGLMPLWLGQGERPPHRSAAVWERLSPEDREAILAPHRQAWRAERDVLLHGLPPDGTEPYGMEVPSGLTSNEGSDDFGWGVAGEWLDYRFPGLQAAAQFLDMRQVFGDERGPDLRYPPYHKNLCGELAAMHVLEVPLSEGLPRFSELPFDDGSRGDSILMDADRLTRPAHLEAFLEAYGWTVAFDSSFTHPPSTATPDYLRGLIESGRSVIVAVSATKEDVRLAGIEPEDGIENISHWVRVLGVHGVSSGETIVHVYNSYENREEVYSWATFAAAWEQAPGLSTQRLTLIAEPPSTPAEPHG